MQPLLAHEQIIDLYGARVEAVETEEPREPLLPKFLGRKPPPSAMEQLIARRVIAEGPGQLATVRTAAPALYQILVENLGKAYCMHGQLDEGRRYLEEAIALYPKGENYAEEVADLLFILARAYDERLDLDATAGYLTRIAQLVEHEDAQVYTNIMTMLFEAHQRRRDYPQAMAVLRAVRPLAAKTMLPGDQVALLIHLSTTELFCQEYAAARDTATQGLAQAEALGQPQHRGTLRRNLQRALFHLGDYRGSAAQEELQVAQLRERGDLPALRARLGDLAMSYLLAQEEEQAVRCLKEALELPLDTDPPLAYHANLGTAYLQLGELALARQHLERALDGSQEGRAASRRYTILFNLAAVHRQEGDGPTALRLAQQALSEARSAGDDLQSGRLQAMVQELTDALAPWGSPADRLPS